MDIRQVLLKEIAPAKYNPRKDLKPGDSEYEGIKRSLEHFGMVDPLVWNIRTGNLVGGHQRFKVLKANGSKEFPCVVVDLDDADEKALNLALNKTGGDWDAEKLVDLLTELLDTLPDVTLTGFTQEEIDVLLGKVPEIEEDGVDDDMTEVVIVAFKLSRGEFQTLSAEFDGFAKRIGITPNIQEV